MWSSTEMGSRSGPNRLLWDSAQHRDVRDDERVYLGVSHASRRPSISTSANTSTSTTTVDTVARIEGIERRLLQCREHVHRASSVSQSDAHDHSVTQTSNPAGSIFSTGAQNSNFSLSSPLKTNTYRANNFNTNDTFYHRTVARDDRMEASRRAASRNSHATASAPSANYTVIIASDEGRVYKGEALNTNNEGRGMQSIRSKVIRATEQDNDHEVDRRGFLRTSDGGGGGRAVRSSAMEPPPTATIPLLHRLETLVSKLESHTSSSSSPLPTEKRGPTLGLLGDREREHRATYSIGLDTALNNSRWLRGGGEGGGGVNEGRAANDDQYANDSEESESTSAIRRRAERLLADDGTAARAATARSRGKGYTSYSQQRSRSGGRKGGVAGGGEGRIILSSSGTASSKHFSGSSSSSSSLPLTKTTSTAPYFSTTPAATPTTAAALIGGESWRSHLERYGELLLQQSFSAKRDLLLNNSSKADNNNGKRNYLSPVKGGMAREKEKENASRTILLMELEARERRRGRVTKRQEEGEKGKQSARGSASTRTRKRVAESIFEEEETEKMAKRQSSRSSSASSFRGVGTDKQQANRAGGESYSSSSSTCSGDDNSFYASSDGTNPPKTAHLLPSYSGAYVAEPPRAHGTSSHLVAPPTPKAENSSKVRGDARARTTSNKQPAHQMPFSPASARPQPASHEASSARPTPPSSSFVQTRLNILLAEQKDLLSRLENQSPALQKLIALETERRKAERDAEKRRKDLEAQLELERERERKDALVREQELQRDRLEIAEREEKERQREGRRRMATEEDIERARKVREEEEERTTISKWEQERRKETEEICARRVEEEKEKQKEKNKEEMARLAEIAVPTQDHLGHIRNGREERDTAGINKATVGKSDGGATDSRYTSSEDESLVGSDLSGTAAFPSATRQRQGSKKKKKRTDGRENDEERGRGRGTHNRPLLASTSEERHNNRYSSSPTSPSSASVSLQRETPHHQRGNTNKTYDDGHRLAARRRGIQDQQGENKKERKEHFIIYRRDVHIEKGKRDRLDEHEEEEGDDHLHTADYYDVRHGPPRREEKGEGRIIFGDDRANTDNITRIHLADHTSHSSSGYTNHYLQSSSSVGENVLMMNPNPTTTTTAALRSFVGESEPHANVDGVHSANKRGATDNSQQANALLMAALELTTKVLAQQHEERQQQRQNAQEGEKANVTRSKGNKKSDQNKKRITNRDDKKKSSGNSSADDSLSTSSSSSSPSLNSISSPERKSNVAEEKDTRMKTTKSLPNHPKGGSEGDRQKPATSIDLDHNNLPEHEPAINSINNESATADTQPPLLPLLPPPSAAVGDTASSYIPPPLPLLPLLEKVIEAAAIDAERRSARDHEVLKQALDLAREATATSFSTVSNAAMAAISNVTATSAAVAAASSSSLTMQPHFSRRPPLSSSTPEEETFSENVGNDLDHHVVSDVRRRTTSHGAEAEPAKKSSTLTSTAVAVGGGNSGGGGNEAKATQAKTEDMPHTIAAAANDEKDSTSPHKLVNASTNKSLLTSVGVNMEDERKVSSVPRVEKETEAETKADKEAAVTVVGMQHSVMMTGEPSLNEGNSSSTALDNSTITGNRNNNRNIRTIIDQISGQRGASPQQQKKVSSAEQEQRRKLYSSPSSVPSFVSVSDPSSFLSSASAAALLLHSPRSVLSTREMTRLATPRRGNHQENGKEEQPLSVFLEAASHFYHKQEKSDGQEQHHIRREERDAQQDEAIQRGDGAHSSSFSAPNRKRATATLNTNDSRDGQTILENNPAAATAFKASQKINTIISIVAVNAVPTPIPLPLLSSAATMMPTTIPIPSERHIGSRGGADLPLSRHPLTPPSSTATETAVTLPTTSTAPPLSSVSAHQSFAIRELEKSAETIVANTVRIAAERSLVEAERVLQDRLAAVENVRKREEEALERHLASQRLHYEEQLAAVLAVQREQKKALEEALSGKRGGASGVGDNYNRWHQTPTNTDTSRSTVAESESKGGGRKGRNEDDSKGPHNVHRHRYSSSIDSTAATYSHNTNNTSLGTTLLGSSTVALLEDIPNRSINAGIVPVVAPTGRALEDTRGQQWEKEEEAIRRDRAKNRDHLDYYSEREKALKTQLEKMQNMNKEHELKLLKRQRPRAASSHASTSASFSNSKDTASGTSDARSRARAAESAAINPTPWQTTRSRSSGAAERVGTSRDTTSATSTSASTTMTNWVTLCSRNVKMLASANSKVAEYKDKAKYSSRRSQSALTAPKEGGISASGGTRNPLSRPLSKSPRKVAGSIDEDHSNRDQRVYPEAIATAVAENLIRRHNAEVAKLRKIKNRKYGEVGEGGGGFGSADLAAIARIRDDRASGGASGFIKDPKIKALANVSDLSFVSKITSNSGAKTRRDGIGMGKERNRGEVESEEALSLFYATNNNNTNNNNGNSSSKDEQRSRGSGIKASSPEKPSKLDREPIPMRGFMTTKNERERGGSSSPMPLAATLAPPPHPHASSRRQWDYISPDDLLLVSPSKGRVVNSSDRDKDLFDRPNISPIRRRAEVDRHRSGGATHEEAIDKEKEGSPYDDHYSILRGSLISPRRPLLDHNDKVVAAVRAAQGGDFSPSASRSPSASLLIPPIPNHQLPTASFLEQSNLKYQVEYLAIHKLSEMMSSAMETDRNGEDRAVGLVSSVEREGEGLADNCRVRHGNGESNHRTILSSPHSPSRRGISTRGEDISSSSSYVSSIAFAFSGAVNAYAAGGGGGGLMSVRSPHRHRKCEDPICGKFGLR